MNRLQMLKMLMNSKKNPQEIINQLMSNNPNARSLMNQMQQSGMNPRDFAMQLMKQNNINFDEVKSMANNFGIKL